MNNNELQNIIEAARSASVESGDFIEEMKNELRKFDVADIIAFNNFVKTMIVDLYRWDIWGIAYIVNGGCSDDGFIYFRRWVITQGKQFYTKLKENPDSVFTDAEVTECECEDLTYAIDEVYQELTGNEIPNNAIHDPSSPVGEQWEEDDLAELFPNTSAVYEQGDGLTNR